MKVGVVTFPGSLDDVDAQRAVRLGGHEAVALWHGDHDLRGVDAVVLPGGFSYGDYLRCGAISRFAPVMTEVVRAAGAGMPVLGICNGFQILCESHLLPGALIRNDHRRFVCRDQRLRIDNASTPWTSAYDEGQEVTIVLKNGEGGYVADAATLDRLEGDLGTEPQDGAVTFADGEVQVSDPVDGRGLDPDAAREALVASYLSGEPAELAITRLSPDVDADDVAEAVSSFADPALSAPVVLTVGSEELELSPEQYADALTLTPADGELVPGVDVEALGPVLDQVTAGAGEPVDARFVVRGGTPRVVPGKPAVSYDPDAVATALLEVVTRPEGERTATVEGSVRPPDLTTKEARALGVEEKVSEFTTSFPYAEYRNTNIGRAAEIVDGTLLEPGEVFSLNDIVGERTRENGFTEGFIISDGIFKQDLGGGVSQMATTTFNAMFFAGLEDVEHKPHSFYIDRYPVGREATVAWPTVDLRFRNDSEHGVLVTADLTASTPSSPGEITVRMYSTKRWDVDAITSDRYAYTSPATRTLDTPDCYPNSGYSGFTVDVTRVFREPGSDEVVRREKFNTVYTPSDTVRCVPPGSLSAGGGGNNGGGRG